MQLELFVENALKTESQIKKVKLNEDFFKELRLILIAAGSMLDQIKKNVFYDKPFNVDGLIDNTHLLNAAISRLNNLDVNDVTEYGTEVLINPRIFHSIVGIQTESTELLEALDITKKELDNINIAEEFGDLDWYKAIGVDELGISWDTVLETVIAKLKARYPNKFTSENAINRNLDKERKILDTMETEQTTNR